MPRPLDPATMPVGTRFGKLVTTALPFIDREHGENRHHVDVVCDCGTMTRPLVKHLKDGNTFSCGCSRVGRNAAAYRTSMHTTARTAIQEKASWFWNEKAKPCTDCGQQFPVAAMQFDHLPGKLKDFEINENTCRRVDITLKDLKAERSKCDLVCANCHSGRTRSRSRYAGVSVPWLEHRLAWLEGVRRSDSARFELESNVYQAIIDALVTRGLEAA